MLCKELDLVPNGIYYNREVVNTMLGLAQWANGELEALQSAIEEEKIYQIPIAFIK